MDQNWSNFINNVKFWRKQLNIFYQQFTTHFYKKHIYHLYNNYLYKIYLEICYKKNTNENTGLKSFFCSKMMQLMNHFRTQD